jgi:ketosteroid isomerase-like protein
MSQENVVRGVRYPISLPSQKAAQRRALDERLFIRFRALFRLFGAIWMRLPPRSRLRRLMLTRLVVRGYAAGNRRDFEVLLVGLDPEIEYHPSTNLMAPDMETVFYGRDGYVKVWRYWLDAFKDIGFEPEELLDLGDRILLTAQLRGHGSGSGVAVSEPTFQLVTFRGGLASWQHDFADRSEALEAAARQE